MNKQEVCFHHQSIQPKLIIRSFWKAGFKAGKFISYTSKNACIKALISISQLV